MTFMFKKIFTIVKLNGLIRELETGSRFDPQRSQVIRQLGELGDPRAIEYLSRELELPNLYAHKYEEIAEEIIAALAHIGGEKAIATLIGVLDHPSHRVREATLAVLHHWNWMPQSPLEIVKYAIAMGDWQTALTASDTSHEKNALIGFIGKLPYTSERLNAIQSLSELGDERALDIFLQELDYLSKREAQKEDDPQTKKHTRISAIRGIASIQGFKDFYHLRLAIRGLIHVLGNPDFTKEYMLEGDYKAEVAQALRRFRRQGFDQLVESLQIKDPQLRAARVEALKAFPGAETRRILVNMLADPDARVRREVILAMKEFECPELAEPLAMRLASRSEQDPAPLRELVARLTSILAKYASTLPTEVLETVTNLPEKFSAHIMFEPGDWYDEDISSLTIISFAKGEIERRQRPT